MTTVSAPPVAPAGLWTGGAAVSDTRPPPGGGRQDGGYVPEVDALRGYAMAAVVAMHCKILPFGWMGVWVFYVVSGFAVTTSLLGTRAGRRGSVWAAARHFYVRRALRIWPLYFAFVGLNVLVLLALGNSEPLADVPWLLAFLHNFKMAFTEYTPASDWSAFGHLWTLSVEQQFYLLFPLILLVRGRAARGWLLAALIAAAPVLRAAVGAWAEAMGWPDARAAFLVYVMTPTHVDAFVAGALIAMFRAEAVARPAWARWALVLACAVAATHVCVYAAIGLERVGRPSLEAARNIVSGIMFGQGREVSAYLIPVCAGAALLLGILARAGWCLRLCRVPGLQAIGRVSYGGYLFHIPVLMVLTRTSPFFTTSGPLGHVCLFLTAMPITVAAASLSRAWFEQRFLRARLRYG